MDIIVMGKLHNGMNVRFHGMATEGAVVAAEAMHNILHIAYFSFKKDRFSMIFPKASRTERPTDGPTCTDSRTHLKRLS